MRPLNPDLGVVPVAAQGPQGAGGGLARVDLVAHVSDATQQLQVRRPGVRAAIALPVGATSRLRVPPLICTPSSCPVVNLDTLLARQNWQFGLPGLGRQCAPVDEV